jgi:hypothetical protein
MKKLFSLIAVLFAALSVNAKTAIDFSKVGQPSEVINFNNWEWKDVIQLATGEIVDNKEAQTADDSGVTYFDAGAYEYLVLKYKQCNVATNFILQYNFKGTYGQWGPELNQGQEVLKANTSGVVGIKLSEFKNKCYKIALQTQGEGSLAIEELYWASEAEYNAAVAADPVIPWYPETTDITSKFGKTANEDGTYTFTNASAWNWNGAWFGSYDASYYDYVVVELAKAADFTVQLAIQFTEGDDESVQIPAGELIAKYKIVNKKPIKQMALQNAAVGDFVVKAVYFATAEYVNNMAGPESINLSLADLNSGWNAEYNADTKTVTVTGTEEGASGGKGWWLESKNYSAFDNFVMEFDPATTFGGKVVVEYTTDGATSSEVTFYPGATCVVVALDAANKNAVKQIYVMGDKGSTYILKAAYVAIASATPEANIGTDTGIQTAKIGELNSGVCYNLAGQKIYASYKGLVIKNGKKVFVK